MKKANCIAVQKKHDLSTDYLKEIKSDFEKEALIFLLELLFSFESNA